MTGRMTTPALRVVDAVAPADREEVRKLPDEEDREEREPGQADGAPVAAVYPPSGGSAPGTAPTIVEACDRVFIGV